MLRYYNLLKPIKFYKQAEFCQRSTLSNTKVEELEQFLQTQSVAMVTQPSTALMRVWAGGFTAHMEMAEVKYVQVGALLSQFTIH